ncbi:MAG: hypothetical protein IPG04_18895 [Polyangiaceae bacterium]|nr:hypothetical protein [Polyangiaceae bacterium]
MDAADRIVVDARAELELVLDRSGLGLEQELRLEPLRDEGPVVGADQDRLVARGRRDRTVEDALVQPVGWGVGALQHVRELRAAEAVHFAPGPGEIVSVERRGHLEIGAAARDMGERDLGAVPLHAVELARRVAPQRVGLEVLLGEAEVGLVGELVRVPELQLELVQQGLLAPEARARLEHELVAGEAGVGVVEAIDALEAVVREVHALDHHAEVIPEAEART